MSEMNKNKNLQIFKNQEICQINGRKSYKKKQFSLPNVATLLFSNE